MEKSVFLEKRIEKTADGSSTIYLPLLDEHYHSIKGAYTESTHIFLNCGLLHCQKKIVRVLEVGFGTGLNAAITACHCEGKQVEYHTFELYPLNEKEIENTGYFDFLPKNESEMLRLIHHADWNKLISISPRFSLLKSECDFTATETELPTETDVIYFDAFAPEKQPEMWTKTIFQRLFTCMSKGGTLVTYCAKGEIRRRLQDCGFIVERLAGPPGGKREILRATK